MFIKIDVRRVEKASDFTHWCFVHLCGWEGESIGQHVFEEWFNQQLLVDSRSCAIKLQMFHDGTTTSQHYLTSSQCHHYSGEGGCYTDPQPCGSWGGVAGECSPVFIYIFTYVYTSIYAYSKYMVVSI